MKAMGTEIGVIHFVGIGGIGMSGIAEVMHQLGYKVQGSDQSDGYVVEGLRKAGIPVTIGHSPDNLGDASVVVCSTAIARGNPEVEAAIERRLPLVRRAEMLAELMRMGSTIAVAGTHGKTTTTSLTGWLLTAAGADPTVLVGGIARNFGASGAGGASYRVGKGKAFVIEGDEYDSAYFDKTAKFLKYLPDIAVINNIEFDHADIYADIDEVRLAFRRLVNLVPSGGLTLIGIDSPDAAAMAAR
ncbi:Mur ligase domain-containing protein, partial [Sphingomonas sp.]|uniref:Mur ligase domain-containing protein n=1 Tax=Sphingomonas sp. TaxID=28214 RepID=UPI0037539284